MIHKIFIIMAITLGTTYGSVCHELRDLTSEKIDSLEIVKEELKSVQYEIRMVRQNTDAEKALVLFEERLRNKKIPKLKNEIISVDEQYREACE